FRSRAQRSSAGGLSERLRPREAAHVAEQIRARERVQRRGEASRLGQRGGVDDIQDRRAQLTWFQVLGRGPGTGTYWRDFRRLERNWRVLPVPELRDVQLLSGVRSSEHRLREHAASRNGNEPRVLLVGGQCALPQQLPPRGPVLPDPRRLVLFDG